MVVDEPKAMQRTVPEHPAERVAYVTDWHKRICEAKDTHFKGQFDKMLSNMKFVRGRQWSDNEKDERYLCNITLRFLQKRTAALYAKNPRAITELRKRMEYAIWDESAESLMAAQQMPTDPVMAMILEDYHQGTLRKLQLEGVAKTLEYLYAYYMNEARPSFKQQLKQLVRRVLTTGVGYVEIGFQRDMQPSPNQIERVKDFTTQLEHLEALAADAADEEFDANDKQMEELRIAIESVMQEEQIIVREGLILDFPKSTSIIPDPATTQLKGFIGSNWIAREYFMTCDQVKTYYGKDIGTNFKTYSMGKEYVQAQTGNAVNSAKTLARVWKVFDLLNGTEMHLCEGYQDFLRDDLTPQLRFEQGHPFHVLTFNDIEDERNIFPDADVDLMRHQQMEYNRSREALREHRVASKPGWISPKGMWDESDLQKIGNHLAHELMQLSIPVTQNLDINKLIIPKPVANIDPNIYDVEFLFTDVLRSTGDHEATFGGSSGDTATEVSVAEQSRVSSVESNTDDMDDFLTAIARDSGQVLLLNMGQDEVKKIVGPGAMWPQYSAQDAADEIVLSIQAGSSGRPNKAQELANFERVAPYIMQIPGINPKWLGEQVLVRMDDKLDLNEAFLEGMPSIIAMNAMAKSQMTGLGGAPAEEGAQGNASDGNNQPEVQGDNGANNQENPQQTPPGGQPAYPAYPIN